MPFAGMLRACLRRGCLEAPGLTYNL